ncbi:BlaI/MecI/CopY family transcriptional regulator [candidate division KSB1 bacterium]|nr:BlaI/MecI/CopY family transcriptional regulator [candidate division KSB1 bacterium]
MHLLSDLEWQIIQIIWNKNETTVKDVWETGFPNQEKAYTTIQTYMDRMVEKGFLIKRKLGLVNFYAASIQQETLMKQATENLISRAFNGSIGQLTAFLINAYHLSESDLQEIKSLIEQKEQSQ